MKVWSKVIAVCMATLLSLSLLAGCSGDEKESVETGNVAEGGSDTASTDENSIIPKDLDTIKIVLFGEESPRMKELMENEFQQVFIDEINTKVELIYVPWTEYGTGGKVDLMIAAGQEFDAALTDADWAAVSYSRGYLQDLAPYIEKYMPDYKVNVDPTAQEAYKFDGNGGVYAIPIGNKPLAGVYNTVCVRQDLMDAMGLTEMSTLDDLTAYAKGAKENYDLYATYDLAHSEYIIRGTSDRSMTPLTTGLWIDQNSHELINFAASDEFESAVRLYNEWNEMGLLPKDMLTNTITLPFQSNMVSFFRGTCGTTKIENEPGLLQIVPDASTEEYYIAPNKPVYKKQYENTAFQVPITTEKADRVALFVNLLQKNSEMANLFAYGVEGTDYEIIDGKVSKINTSELFYEWMLYNIKISTPTTAYTDEFMERYRTWDDEAITDITFGFSINYDNIKVEKAQIDSIWTEYAQPLLAGVVDYDSNIDMLIEKLDNAGWDKYVAEIQSQLDAFLASK